jgi:hypothetical protein
MLKTYLYIPEHLEEKINLTAKVQKTSKAEIMRRALEKGMEIVNQQNGAQVLLDLSKKVHETLKDEKLPKDLSVNHDYYLWDLPKKVSKNKK